LLAVSLISCKKDGKTMNPKDSLTAKKDSVIIPEFTKNITAFIRVILQEWKSLRMI
jgi:hypothetical protein